MGHVHAWAIRTCQRQNHYGNISRHVDRETENCKIAEETDKRGPHIFVKLNDCQSVTSHLTKNIYVHDYQTCAGYTITCSRRLCTPIRSIAPFGWENLSVEGTYNYIHTSTAHASSKKHTFTAHQIVPLPTRRTRPAQTTSILPIRQLYLYHCFLHPNHTVFLFPLCSLKFFGLLHSTHNRTRVTPH